MNKTKQANETEPFTDAAFMSAAEKRNVLKAWVRFVKSGFEWQYFTKALYQHLTLHCSFIAHYNRGGFFATYFKEPEATQRFLNQFDRSTGCLSVEYGTAWWLGDEHDEYWDINNAMIDSIENVLPTVRRVLSAQELAGAQASSSWCNNKLPDCWPAREDHNELVATAPRWIPGTVKPDQCRQGSGMARTSQRVLAASQPGGLRVRHGHLLAGMLREAGPHGVPDSPISLPAQLQCVEGHALSSGDGRTADRTAGLDEVQPVSNSRGRGLFQSR